MQLCSLDVKHGSLREVGGYASEETVFYSIEKAGGGWRYLRLNEASQELHL